MISLIDYERSAPSKESSPIRRIDLAGYDEDFKALMKEEYCPNNEIQRLFPHLVAPENKMIERYIYGLASQIRGMVEATEPRIIQNAILKVGVLTDEAVRNGSLKRSGERRGDGGESSKE
nr:hypothetical protein [Tanacetum cinerariifolium]